MRLSLTRPSLCVAVSLAAASAFAQTELLIGPYQRYEDARSRGDFAAAAGFAEQSLAVTERQAGVDSADYANALERAGRAYADAGAPDAAVRYLERAIKAKEELLGEDHPDLIDPLDALADIHIKRRNFASARAALERVLSIEIGVYSERHDNTTATMRWLEELYRASGDVAAADVMAQRIADASVFTRSLEDTDSDFTMVKVFYGTDRNRTGREKPAQYYGSDRGDLELGYLDVSIPKTHKYGALESESMFSIVLGEEAKRKRYVLLHSVSPLTGDVFYETLRDYVEDKESNDILLFVHGYNVVFADAARRAAQLAYDLDFDGTPMMYSWPSQGSTAAYTVDEAVVRPSGRKLARLLDGIVAETGAERIHLIAHSMGNRALIEALQAYILNHGREASRNTFDQVVFTAPDVDRDYFIDVMESIQTVAQRTTLYASENDVALRSSRILHGAPRAGLAGNSLVVLPELDTIDMSAVEADMLGHSYFAANEGAIYDLFWLLWRDEERPSRCGMQWNEMSTLGFWSFNVDDCRGRELLQAGVLLKRFREKARARIEERIGRLTEPGEVTEKEEWSRILDRLNSLINPTLGAVH